MKLADYLKDSESDDFPPEGTKGVETDWLDLDTMEVSSGSLWAGDPYQCACKDGYEAKVPKGTYVVEAKAMDFAGDKRVSRLRAHLQGAKNPTLGEQIGETFTDIGAIALCDIVAIDQAVGGDSDEFFERIKQHYYENCGVYQFKMKGLIRLPYVATGFGDCGAPVFELLAKRRRVGIELQFLPPNYEFHKDDDL